MDEFNTLREEILFNLASIEKYLVSTVIAYSTFTFWSFSNPRAIYLEIFNLIIYLLLIISMNIISTKIHHCQKISGYISIVLCLNNNTKNWETLLGKFNKRFSAAPFGQPGTILLFLGIITLLFNAFTYVQDMPKIFPNSHPFISIIMFLSFLCASILIFLAYKKTYIRTMYLWLEIAREENIITENDIEKFIKEYLNVENY